MGDEKEVGGSTTGGCPVPRLTVVVVGEVGEGVGEGVGRCQVETKEMATRWRK